MAREKTRRSQLLSWILLALFIADAVLAPIGVGDASTLIGIAIVFVGLLIAIFLNRRGYLTAAGILPIVLICLADLFSIVSVSGGLTVDTLPAYDLLCLAVVVAASVLQPSAAFVVAILNTVAIIADYFLQPHASDLVADVNTYASPTIGNISLLARPIALEIVLAGIAYLWVRGSLRAIQRADRAEELAALQTAIVEQKEQLDIGIQEVLQTHVRASNGDFSARVTQIPRQNVLWQVGISLNNLLARVQRAGQAEHQLQRTEQEIARLQGALQDTLQGRQPVLPAPSRTAVDRLLGPVAQMVGMLSRRYNEPPVGGGPSGPGDGPPISRYLAPGNAPTSYPPMGGGEARNPYPSTDQEAWDQGSWEQEWDKR